jgi:hypothetical protein
VGLALLALHTAYDADLATPTTWPSGWLKRPISTASLRCRHSRSANVETPVEFFRYTLRAELLGWAVGIGDAALNYHTAAIALRTLASPD